MALAFVESLEGKGPTSTTTLSPEEIAARKACPSVFLACLRVAMENRGPSLQSVGQEANFESMHSALAGHALG